MFLDGYQAVRLSPTLPKQSSLHLVAGLEYALVFIWLGWNYVLRLLNSSVTVGVLNWHLLQQQLA
jgi:hypothetical protein